MKNTLTVLSVVSFGLAALGVSVASLSLIPTGLGLYVASKLVK